MSYTDACAQVTWDYLSCEGFVVLNHKTYLRRHAERAAGCGVTCKSEAPHFPMGTRAVSAVFCS